MVPVGRKAQLLVLAARRAQRGAQAASRSPALAETGFLVDAVTLETPRSSGPRLGWRAGFSGDLAWMIDLFSQLQGRAGAKAGALIQRRAACVD
jgi:hypothetical protein